VATHEISPSKTKNAAESTGQARISEAAALVPSLEQPLTASLLLHLQRTAGNAAVNTLIRRREHGEDNSSANGPAWLAVQRHPEGDALPEKSDLVSEVTKKEAPAATRSLRQEKADKQAATTSIPPRIIAESWAKHSTKEARNTSPVRR